MKIPFLFKKFIFFFILLIFASHLLSAKDTKWYKLNIPDKLNVVKCSNEINWITIKNGHFVTRNNGKRIRFFGSTVGWGYPNASHKVIDRSVAYLKSLGINCVRIHYPGLWDRNKNAFDSSHIEKFDYLTYSLSKHKIYYIIYSMNMLYLNYKGYDGFSFHEMKGATLMDMLYRKNIKIFWDSLLNHRNIYNGIKYKNDSALACVILTNENSTDKILTMSNGKKLLKIYWDKHKSKYGFNNITFCSDKNSDNYRYVLQFAAKEDSSYFVEMKNFLRRSGLKVPITFTNNPYSYYTQKTLSKIVDFIGVHTYGKYAGGYSSKIIKSHSPLIFKDNSPSDFPRRILTVNYSKPVLVDEWNIGYPSIYRLESVILIPSLASFYNYDGSLFFTMFSHKRYLRNPHKRQKYYLTSLEAPYSLQALFFPVISYAFRRGYIPIYTDSMIINVNDTNDKIDGMFQYRFNPLTGKKGLIYFMKRVIIKFSDKSNLKNIRTDIPKDNIIKNKFLYWNYKRGIFSVVDKYFIAFAGSSNDKFSFKEFEVKSKNNRLCLAIIPIDNTPINSSGKLLMVIGENALHYGDDKLIKGRVFDKYVTYYPGYKEQTSIFRIPATLLIKSIHAEISLPYKKTNSLCLYALYPNGNKKYISTIRIKNNKIDFDINTNKYKTCYYLIVNRKTN